MWQLRLLDIYKQLTLVRKEDRTKTLIFFLVLICRVKMGLGSFRFLTSSWLNFKWRLHLLTSRCRLSKKDKRCHLTSIRRVGSKNIYFRSRIRKIFRTSCFPKSFLITMTASTFLFNGCGLLYLFIYFIYSISYEPLNYVTIQWLNISERVRPNGKKYPDMIWAIWWWGSSSENCWILFITISPTSTQAHICRTYLVPIYWSNKVI